MIADQDEIGDYRKEYDTYDALCEELGIKLLNSDLSKNNTLMMIQRKTDNENWEEIRISPYILGDISKIEKVEGEKFLVLGKRLSGNLCVCGKLSVKTRISG